MSQYELNILYIPGPNNTAADVLSCVPAGAFLDKDGKPNGPHKTGVVSTVLHLTTDSNILQSIKVGYNEDSFCKKFIASGISIKGIRNANGLWYVGDRLLIPRVGDIRENLFRLVHDTASHFGADKLYATLHDAYYWPNMCRDLKEAYIPACTECQHNKSQTKKPASPLHPLPIPDKCCDSITMDFIGPLPLDEGFNCISSMTDRLNSDFHTIPTQTDISAKDLAILFFNNWYCENGLPLEIMSDWDKLFVSTFWCMLHKLTGCQVKALVVVPPTN
jgi:hypothetical protein